MGEQNTVQKAAQPGRALALQALEIRRIKRSSVRNRAVMLCMLAQGTKHSGQRLGQESAQIPGDFHRLVGLCQSSAKPQFDGFIQRNAEHRVVGFEVLNLIVKNGGLFLRQPRTPILFDTGAAEGRGADAVSHESSPGDQAPEYSKISARGEGCSSLFSHSYSQGGCDGDHNERTTRSPAPLFPSTGPRPGEFLAQG